MVQALVLSMIFLSVAGFVWGIGAWLSRDEATERRLDRLSKPTAAIDKAAEAARPWQARVAKISAPIAWLSEPKEGWESSNFRVRFMHAGLRGPGWPVIFFGAKTFFTLALPGLLLLFGSIANRSTAAQATLLTLVLLAAFGYYFPNLVLMLMIRWRQREVLEALPDAVDLMRVCVEAGLGLDAAMNRAAEEMDLRSKELADELKLVALDLRVGATRERAMENLALRTGVDDVATFVNILRQSEHFGTNVAESLRVLSDTMRDHRKIRAEEAAAKIPLKLLFPLIFFMFPALFVVILGPAVLSIFRTLIPTLGGQ